MPLLVEVKSGPHYWLGSYGPLLVCIWLGEIEPSVCRSLVDQARRFCAKLRTGNTSVISISCMGTPAPSAEARQALAALLRDTDHCVQRVAVVRAGEGFGSAIVSSVVSALQMLVRPTAAHRCFRDIEEGIGWASAELHDASASQIVAREAALVLGKQIEFLTLRQRVAS